MALDGDTVTIKAWTFEAGAAVDLVTSWRIVTSEGAGVVAQPGGYRLNFDRAGHPPGYVQAIAVIRFQRAS